MLCQISEMRHEALLYMCYIYNIADHSMIRQHNMTRASLQYMWTVVISAGATERLCYYDSGTESYMICSVCEPLTTHIK